MPTDKQIQAARTNGALSRGPVTPEGKHNSSRNNTRHSLLAQTVVLEAENRTQFIDLLQSFMNEYQPATPTETVLVETMAAAHWRILRVMSLQKLAFDRDIALQDPAIGPPPVRALFSLGGSLPRTACAPELLLRYETTYNRQFSRAHARLLAVQSAPSQQGPAAPYFPPLPDGNLWNLDQTTPTPIQPQPDLKEINSTIEPQHPLEAPVGRAPWPAAAPPVGLPAPPQPPIPKLNPTIRTQQPPENTPARPHHPTSPPPPPV